MFEKVISVQTVVRDFGENVGIDLLSALKAINIKDVIYMTGKLYDDIPSTTLIKSWQKAWPDIENMVNNIANSDLLQIEDEPPENSAQLLNGLMKLAPLMITKS